LQGVQRLAQMKKDRHQELPVLHMRFIAMKHNEHELSQVASFAAENGFDIVSVGSLTIRDLDKSEHRQRVPQTKHFRAYDYADGHRVKRNDFICQQAFLFPAVFADGTVTVCDDDFNGTHPYGRFDVDGSFGEIWFGRKAAAIRKVIRTSRETFKFCRNCPLADRPTDTGSVEVLDLRKGTSRMEWSKKLEALRSRFEHQAV
jgi:MoaA/NifB/PqqE/SkfB family radical SAM enzyme